MASTASSWSSQQRMTAVSTDAGRRQPAQRPIEHGTSAEEAGGAVGRRPARAASTARRRSAPFAWWCSCRHPHRAPACRFSIGSIDLVHQGDEVGGGALQTPRTFSMSRTDLHPAAARRRSASGGGNPSVGHVPFDLGLLGHLPSPGRTSGRGRSSRPAAASISAMSRVHPRVASPEVVAQLFQQRQRPAADRDSISARLVAPFSSARRYTRSSRCAAVGRLRRPRGQRARAVLPRSPRRAA